MRRLLLRIYLYEHGAGRARPTFAEMLDAEIRSMVRRRIADVPMPSARDVSQSMQDLLAAENARVAKRYIRDLTISKSEFAALVLNASHFGYAHETFGYEKVPSHLQLTNEERHAFFYERAESPDLVARATRKVERAFAERRVYTAHVFANGDRWHVFSFTYNDAQLGRRGHWAGGAHVHYLSSVLDPRRTLAEVVADLRAPEREVHGEHLRCNFDE